MDINMSNDSGGYDDDVMTKKKILMGLLEEDYTDVMHSSRVKSSDDVVKKKPMSQRQKAKMQRSSSGQLSSSSPLIRTVHKTKSRVLFSKSKNDKIIKGSGNSRLSEEDERLTDNIKRTCIKIGLIKEGGDVDIDSTRETIYYIMRYNIKMGNVIEAFKCAYVMDDDNLDGHVWSCLFSCSFGYAGSSSPWVCMGLMEIYTEWKNTRPCKNCVRCEKREKCLRRKIIMLRAVTYITICQKSRRIYRLSAITLMSNEEKDLDISDWEVKFGISFNLISKIRSLKSIVPNKRMRKIINCIVMSVIHNDEHRAVKMASICNRSGLANLFWKCIKLIVNRQKGFSWAKPYIDSCINGASIAYQNSPNSVMAVNSMRDAMISVAITLCSQRFSRRYKRANGCTPEELGPAEANAMIKSMPDDQASLICNRIDSLKEKHNGILGAYLSIINNNLGKYNNNADAGEVPKKENYVSVINSKDNMANVDFMDEAKNHDINDVFFDKLLYPNMKEYITRTRPPRIPTIEPFVERFMYEMIIDPSSSSSNDHSSPINKNMLSPTPQHIIKEKQKHRKNNNGNRRKNCGDVDENNTIYSSGRSTPDHLYDIHKHDDESLYDDENSMMTLSHNTQQQQQQQQQQHGNGSVHRDFQFYDHNDDDDRSKKRRQYNEYYDGYGYDDDTGSNHSSSYDSTQKDTIDESSSYYYDNGRTYNNELNNQMNDLSITKGVKEGHDYFCMEEEEYHYKEHSTDDGTKVPVEDLVNLVRLTDRIKILLDNGTGLLHPLDPILKKDTVMEPEFMELNNMTMRNMYVLSDNSIIPDHILRKASIGIMANIILRLIMGLRISIKEGDIIVDTKEPHHVYSMNEFSIDKYGTVIVQDPLHMDINGDEYGNDDISSDMIFILMYNMKHSQPVQSESGNTATAAAISIPSNDHDDVIRHHLMRIPKKILKVLNYVSDENESPETNGTCKKQIDTYLNMMDKNTIKTSSVNGNNMMMGHDQGNTRHEEENIIISKIVKNRTNKPFIKRIVHILMRWLMKLSQTKEIMDLSRQYENMINLHLNKEPDYATAGMKDRTRIPNNKRFDIRINMLSQLAKIVT